MIGWWTAINSLPSRLRPTANLAYPTDDNDVAPDPCENLLSYNPPLRKLMPNIGWVELREPDNAPIQIPQDLSCFNFISNVPNNTCTSHIMCSDPAPIEESNGICSCKSANQQNIPYSPFGNLCPLIYCADTPCDPATGMCTRYSTKPSGPLPLQIPPYRPRPVENYKWIPNFILYVCTFAE